MTSAELLKSEISELREKGHQFDRGEITRGDFKGLSGGRGVYAQKEQGKYMIRLRTSSGIVTRKHLERIVSYAEKYQLDKIHLTTRQAIQLHELSIDEICDIMDDAIDYGLFTRGSGGNFPRNVTLSPLSGVDAKEVFDVTPYAIQASQYFQDRITTYHLPRKFKVAFSSTKDDTGCATINDVGFIGVEKDKKSYFQLYLGGGLGGGPAVAIPYPTLIEPEKILYYVEAMMNVFQKEGDYEHRGKARSRFIVKRMGVEDFLTCFNQHLAEVEKTQKFEGIPAKNVEKEVWSPQLLPSNLVIPQRQKGLYTFVIHPLCGQLSTTDGKKLLEFVSEKEKVDLRITMTQDIYVRNLTKVEVEALMELTKSYNQTKIHGRTVTCVGTPTCQIGIQQSQFLAEEIAKRMDKEGLSTEKLPLMQMNGCMNSCSRHPVAPLGFAGFAKKVDQVSVPYFYLFVGGKVGEEAKLAERLGAIEATKIPDFLVDLVNVLNENTLTYEAFSKTQAFHELVERYL